MSEKIKITCFHIENIKNARKKANITTDVLSVMIGRNSSYISQIESGRIKTITQDELCKIADAVGCKTNELLEIEESKQRALDKINDGLSVYDRLKRENKELKKENEQLKKKLEDIMKIISQ